MAPGNERGKESDGTSKTTTQNSRHPAPKRKKRNATEIRKKFRSSSTCGWTLGDTKHTLFGLGRERESDLICLETLESHALQQLKAFLDMCGCREKEKREWQKEGGEEEKAGLVPEGLSLSGQVGSGRKERSRGETRPENTTHSMRYFTNKNTYARTVLFKRISMCKTITQVVIVRFLYRSKLPFYSICLQ